MISKIFSPKNLAKILAFFAQTNASFCKNLIITLVFKKNANIFAENWQKSQKIVIVTSTPGLCTFYSTISPRPFYQTAIHFRGNCEQCQTTDSCLLKLFAPPNLPTYIRRCPLVVVAIG
jgi:hypothetical protein